MNKASIVALMLALASPTVSAGLLKGKSCEKTSGSVAEDYFESKLKFLNKAAKLGKCTKAVEDSGILENVSKDATFYNVVTKDSSKLEYYETLLVQCEVIQFLTEAVKADPGFFDFGAYVNKDGDLFCDDKLSFAYGTGGYDVLIAGEIGPLPIPLRGTAGLVASKPTKKDTKNGGWEIQHVHESLDIEAILEFLFGEYLKAPSAKSDVSLDEMAFEKIISPLSDEHKESWRKHIGKYCEKK